MKHLHTDTAWFHSCLNKQYFSFTPYVLAQCLLEKKSPHNLKQNKKRKKERIREQKEKTKKETAMIHRLRWNLWKEFDPVDAEDGRSDALFHFLPFFFFPPPA